MVPLEMRDQIIGNGEVRIEEDYLQGKMTLWERLRSSRLFDTRQAKMFSSRSILLARSVNAWERQTLFENMAISDHQMQGRTDSRFGITENIALARQDAMQLEDRARQIIWGGFGKP